MKFFTSAEIIRSVVLAFTLGVFFGCIYSASGRIFSSLSRLLSSAPLVYRKIKSFSKTVVAELLYQKSESHLTNIALNVCDAIVFSAFGISSLILFYIALDGVFRIYVAATLIFGFFLAKKTIGSVFCRLYDWVFGFFYRFILYVEYTALYPVYIIVNFIKMIFAKVINPIKRRIGKRRRNSLKRKKINEIKKAFG